jgi:hypothetical protein
VRQVLLWLRAATHLDQGDFRFVRTHFGF